MSIKLPFQPSKAAQAVVAFLAATGSVGNLALHEYARWLPASWALAVSGALAILSGVSGFIEKAEPLIADLDPATPAVPVP